MLAASGEYTGDATDNRDITTSLGVTPDFVVVKRMSGITGNFTPVIRTSTMSGDLSKPVAATAATSNIIQSFGSGTFQVGTGDRANRNSTAYAYLACADDGNGGFSVFSYTGNGGGARTITPGGTFNFVPAFAIVCPEDGADPYWASDQHTVGDSQAFDQAVVTTAITALGSGSLSVASGLNTNAVIYHVAVWKLGAGCVSTVAYVGDNSSPRSINHDLAEIPLFGIGQGQDGSSFLSRWKMGSSSTTTSARVNGNGSIGGINDLTSSATFSVGNDTSINESGTNYVAVMFGSTFADLPSFRGLALLGVGT